jgi:hypothetical protein
VVLDYFFVENNPWRVSISFAIRFQVFMAVSEECGLLAYRFHHQGRSLNQARRQQQTANSHNDTTLKHASNFTKICLSDSSFMTIVMVTTFRLTFTVYVQFRLMFTLILFIVNAHNMFWPNWPSSSVQVMLRGYCFGFLYVLIACCSHARVRFILLFCVRQS